MVQLDHLCEHNAMSVYDFFQFITHKEVIDQVIQNPIAIYQKKDAKQPLTKTEFKLLPNDMVQFPQGKNAYAIRKVSWFIQFSALRGLVYQHKVRSISSEQEQLPAQESTKRKATIPTTDANSPQKQKTTIRLHLGLDDEERDDDSKNNDGSEHDDDILQKDPKQDDSKKSATKKPATEKSIPKKATTTKMSSKRREREEEDIVKQVLRQLRLIKSQAHDHGEDVNEELIKDIRNDQLNTDDHDDFGQGLPSTSSSINQIGHIQPPPPPSTSRHHRHDDNRNDDSSDDDYDFDMGNRLVTGTKSLSWMRAFPGTTFFTLKECKDLDMDETNRLHDAVSSLVRSTLEHAADKGNKNANTWMRAQLITLHEGIHGVLMSQKLAQWAIIAHKKKGVKMYPKNFEASMTEINSKILTILAVQLIQIFETCAANSSNGLGMLMRDKTFSPENIAITERTTFLSEILREVYIDEKEPTHPTSTKPGPTQRNWALVEDMYAHKLKHHVTSTAKNNEYKKSKQDINKTSHSGFAPKNGGGAKKKFFQFDGKKQQHQGKGGFYKGGQKSEDKKS